MCGLTGFLCTAGTADELRASVRRMSDAIVHRGPDDSGEFVDAASGLALGFRRLAIVDLSAAGHQPMTSASGRYVIVFNGEVYNFETIRAELRAEGNAPDFRGHSDTEVMLAAVEAWGLERAVKRFIGMFAFALWDTRERTLHLVRDRLGVKPMYYGFAGNSLLFGSELKALRPHPDFDATLNRDAVAAYLRYLYVPAPLSIYRGIHKQTPGTILTITPDRQVRTTVYWSAREAAQQGTTHRFSGSAQDAADELDALLRDAVAMRMVADVPLGVFLSGGIDSSLVTALMQVQATQPVKTFTIGFTEGAYNEAEYAAAIARHLGTAHTELYVTPQDALDVIPRLPEMYDEPFADSSQIPTYLVSAMARRHVTVSLSGEGGDELFGGYRRYFEGQRVLSTFGRVPGPLRRAIGRGITTLPSQTWDRLLAWRMPQAGTQMGKLARVLASRNLDSMYDDVISHWPAGVVRNAAEPQPMSANLANAVERMMLLDQLTYLPDDILAKVDRASMAASLEAREPLLDHRVVEMAWSLPLEMKVHRGTGKRILRDVLDRYVPRELIDRPKMGFKVPIRTWLTGPLRDWAESLLDEKRLSEQGLLDVERVRAAWEAFTSSAAPSSGAPSSGAPSSGAPSSGAPSSGAPASSRPVRRLPAGPDEIWAVLMLQAWMQ